MCRNTGRRLPGARSLIVFVLEKEMARERGRERERERATARLCKLFEFFHGSCLLCAPGSTSLNANSCRRTTQPERNGRLPPSSSAAAPTCPIPEKRRRSSSRRRRRSPRGSDGWVGGSGVLVPCSSSGGCRAFPGWLRDVTALRFGFCVHSVCFCLSSSLCL